VKAAKALMPFRGRVARRTSYELAFLPAALEIVDTPPSPIGRATMLTIVSLFSLALLWACLASVDIIATAPGKIVPSGRSKIIQPFETGVVRAIHVQDGQTVKAGDLLIELDPTINDADQAHLRSDLFAAQLDVARLHAALSTEGDPLAAFKPPPGANPAMVATERQLLTDQFNEQSAKLGSLDRQEAEKDAERATTAATIAKIEATMPMLDQRVQVRKYLFEQGLGSKLLYLQEAQDLVANQKELLVQKSHYQEAVAGVAALVEQRAEAAAEYRHALSDELAKDEAKAAGLGQDFVKAEERTKLQRLTAPVDGIVQQLAIHTVGGVVTPAQQLMVVVPVDSHLEIEAMVSNRDIGFIHEGQAANIKVNTFSYTRYGLLHGEVESVSADSIVPASRGDDSNDGGAASDGGDSADGSSKDSSYAARVSLDRSEMQIDDRLVKLTPGMAVTVEIKTGSRRIIGYLLSPLLRYGHESIRER
jgi:hemolysin D